MGEAEQGAMQYSGCSCHAGHDCGLSWSASATELLVCAIALLPSRDAAAVLALVRLQEVSGASLKTDIPGFAPAWVI